MGMQDLPGEDLRHLAFALEGDTGDMRCEHDPFMLQQAFHRVRINSGIKARKVGPLELENELALDWIRAHAAHSPIASVCTGSFLLAQAGLLEGRRATTHWAECDDLEARFPAVQVERDVRFVDEGDVITAAGVAAGIDMSLHLIERFGGRALAEETARLTEVDFP